MGIDSVYEPESELKPPPCRLSSTLSLLAAGMPSGVTMCTGTPAILSSTSVLGISFDHATRARAVYSSVILRRSASGCDAPWSGSAWPSISRACGLRSCGTGITRVTCAVPCASMKLVSRLGASASVVGAGCCAERKAGASGTNESRLRPTTEREKMRMVCLVTNLVRLLRERLRKSLSTIAERALSIPQYAPHLDCQDL